MEPYDSRLAAFKAFHAANPQVWKRFKQMALALRKKGYTHYSHDTLISVIRFQWDIKTNGVPFKIANEHKAFYGRWFVLKYEAWEFFHLRQMEGEPDAVFARYRQEDHDE